MFPSELVVLMWEHESELERQGRTHRLLPVVPQVPDGFVLQLRSKQRVGLSQDGHQPAEQTESRTVRQLTGSVQKLMTGT